jgi:adenylate kinase family enzyme
MRRVLVIGSGGAGKSTFAIELAKRTGLPLVHLDALYWQPGWQPLSKSAWASTVERLIAEERWIMDGNFGGSLERRLAACDTVVFLDLPWWICLWRVIGRRVRHHGRTRPEMSAGCNERLDWAFLWWIFSYPWQRRPAILRRLASLMPGQRAIILRSRQQAENLLDTINLRSTL